MESIRVLDRTGRNLASGEVAAVRLVGTAPELEGVALMPAAVAVEPTTAQVLARFDNPAKSAAVLRNDVGQGQVLLVTATSAEGDAKLWSSLRTLTFEQPPLVVSEEVAARFRFICTRVRDARVLHVIDAAVPATDYRPETISVSLARRQLDGRNRATLVGSDRPLTLLERDGRLEFTVQPDPVATVVLAR